MDDLVHAQHADLLLAHLRADLLALVGNEGVEVELEGRRAAEVQLHGLARGVQRDGREALSLHALERNPQELAVPSEEQLLSRADEAATDDVARPD